MAKNKKQAMNLFYPADLQSKSKSIWVLDAFLKAFPNSSICRSSVLNKDIGVFWGLGNYFNLIKQYKEKNLPFIFTDMPYWNRWNDNNREECYWRIIPNALHCNWVTDFPNDRSKSIQLLDYDCKGDYILVCPSSQTMQAFYNNLNWLDLTITNIKKHTDRPIKIRLKPRNSKTSGPLAADIPFAQDCQHAWAVVTNYSLAGVEAAILGKPVFCDPASACSVLGNIDINTIESPLYPCRQQWLNSLSYYQYTEGEIASGYVNELINDNFLF